MPHTDIGRIFWVAPPWSTRTASPDWKLGSPANMARTTLATSSGVAAMPLGFIPASRLFASAWWWVSRSTMGVSVSQGQTAKTRMFSLAKPAATDWVMLITAGLRRSQQDRVRERQDRADERRGVDDDPAPLPDEEGENLLHAEEDALDVDGQDIVDDLLGALADRAQHALDARVVEQEVQSAVEFDRLVEEAADRVLDPHVGPQELDLITLLRQVVGGGLATNMVAAGNQDFRPCRRQPGCHGLADSGRPACDHGNLSGQGICHESLLCVGTYQSESLRFMDDTLCRTRIHRPVRTTARRPHSAASSLMKMFLYCKQARWTCPLAIALAAVVLQGEPAAGRQIGDLGARDDDLAVQDGPDRVAADGDLEPVPLADGVVGLHPGRHGRAELGAVLGLVRMPYISPEPMGQHQMLTWWVPEPRR